jgi:hypothetical protein
VSRNKHVVRNLKRLSATKLHCTIPHKAVMFKNFENLYNVGGVVLKWTVARKNEKSSVFHALKIDFTG